MFPTPASAARLAVLALALLAAAPLAAQTPAGTLVLGQVIDAQTRAPLASATVRVPAANASVVTGPDGQFRLRLPPGTYAVTLSRLGYETGLENWVVGAESLDMGILELSPAAVSLEELRVVADREERVRVSSGISASSFSGDVLAYSPQSNLLEFLNARYHFTLVPCSSISDQGDPGCVRLRGGPVKPCVVVDERLETSGLAALDVYNTRDAARVNVYGGGRLIQIYTTAFLREAARRDWKPQSPEALLQSVCRLTY